MWVLVGWMLKDEDEKEVKNLDSFLSFKIKICHKWGKYYGAHKRRVGFNVLKSTWNFDQKKKYLNSHFGEIWVKFILSIWSYSVTQILDVWLHNHLIKNLISKSQVFAIVYGIYPLVNIINKNLYFRFIEYVMYMVYIINHRHHLFNEFESVILLRIIIGCMWF